MKEVESVIARMRQVIGAKSDRQLSEMMGFKGTGTVSVWKSRGSVPLPNLQKISQMEGVSVDWLLTGEGDMRPQASCATESKQPSMIAKDMNGLILIPRYNVEASAGGGAVVEEERVVDRMAFKEEWIRAALSVNPKDLAMISTIGDSMEPTLHPGDLLMLDCSVNTVRDNAIYALQVNGTLLVKRLQRRIDGQVVVKSDNPAYETETIGPDAAGSLKVVGRLVWAGRKF